MLYCEDCKETMKKMKAESIPFIITDPPYLLEFMGKEFDKQHKTMAGDNDGQRMYVWHLSWIKEAFRVIKPGGFLVAFGGTRTSHRLTCAMEDVGFEIKNTIMWLYGSGFPKSFDISKGIDKKFDKKREIINQTTSGRYKRLMATNKEQGFRPSDYYPEGNKFKSNIPISPEAQKWNGWGTALKPAYEPIIVGMKPTDKNFVNNALTHGVAGINIDDGRIEIKKEGEDKRLGGRGSWKTDKAFKNIYSGGYEGKDISSNKKGRWPANIILQHHPECKFVGHKKIKGHKGYPNGPQGIYSKNYQKTEKLAKDWNKFSTIKDGESWKGYADKDGKETIKNWRCHPDCPIEILDNQSGTLKSGTNAIRTQEGFFFEHGGLGMAGDVQTTYGDSGGASRFFYTAKVSPEERNLGLSNLPNKTIDDGRSVVSDRPHQKGANPRKNNHPTVKPIDLMVYLVRLFSAPNGGIVYDPFAGSGSTLIACKILDRDCIGSEIDSEYYEIAKQRLKFDWKNWYFQKKSGKTFKKLKEREDQLKMEF